jgi:hypothetical protein
MKQPPPSPPDPGWAGESWWHSSAQTGNCKGCGSIEMPITLHVGDPRIRLAMHGALAAHRFARAPRSEEHGAIPASSNNQFANTSAKSVSLVAK